MGRTSHKCFKNFGQYRKVNEMDSTTKRRGQKHQKDEISFTIQKQRIKRPSGRSLGATRFDSSGVGK